MSENKDKKEVTRIYLGVPSNSSLTIQELRTLWTRMVGIVSSTYGKEYFEIVNTFDSVEVPVNVKNDKAYIVSKRLEQLSKANKYIGISEIWCDDSTEGLVLNIATATFDNDDVILLPKEILGVRYDEIYSDDGVIKFKMRVESR